MLKKLLGIFVVFLFSFSVIFSADPLEVVLKNDCDANKVEISFYDYSDHWNLTQDYSYEEVLANDSLKFKNIDGTLKIYNGPFDNPNELISGVYSANEQVIITISMQLQSTEDTSIVLPIQTSASSKRYLR